MLLLCSLCLVEPGMAKGKVHLERLFRASFQKPVFMVPFPIRYKRLPPLYAIVEQEGMIKLATPRQNSRSQQVAELLNKKKSVCSSSSEEGLLGAAFSNDFKRSGLLYIYYSKCSPRRTLLSRIKIIPRHTKGVRQIKNLRFFTKEEKLLTIPQPYSNHNGGMVAFGKDNYLYIGVGDGGSAGDPKGHGQNRNTLLGTILRIDVRTKKGYKIPQDNPFIHHRKARAEIYAYGLRNPWRFSFDRRGRLIVGDVGQNRFEEVHIVQKGRNYGWNILEGSHCYRPRKNCRKRGLELPVLEYSHREGQCIIGGYVYYGKISWLKGKYIFGDTVSGRIWYSSLKKRNEKTLLFATDHYISSFSTEPNGEVYVIDLLGNIFRIRSDAYRRRGYRNKR